MFTGLRMLSMLPRRSMLVVMLRVFVGRRHPRSSLYPRARLTEREANHGKGDE